MILVLFTYLIICCELQLLLCNLRLYLCPSQNRLSVSATVIYNKSWVIKLYRFEYTENIQGQLPTKLPKCSAMTYRSEIH